MEEQESHTMNLRVAEALEWEVNETFLVGGWRWWRDQEPMTDRYPSRESAEKNVPDFCHDPKATAKVVAEIKSREWFYGMGLASDGAWGVVNVPIADEEPTGLESLDYQQFYRRDVDEVVSLLSAFLAAHESTEGK